MNFSCDRCHKAYTISDEKVAGRSFKVSCRACGHVIQVKAGQAEAAVPGPAAKGAAPAARPQVAASPPAPSTPATAAAPRAPVARATGPAAPAGPRAAPPPAPSPRAPVPPAPAVLAAAPAAAPAATPPPAPILPALAPAAPAAPAAAAPAAAAAGPSLEHQQLDTTQQQDLFFASDPTHRPRVTAEWLLESRRRHPALYLWIGGAAGLLVAGAVAFSLWQVRKARSWPPEASAAARAQPGPAAAAPAQRVVMPAEGVQGEPPPTLQQAPELPVEAPLAQRGAAPPKAVGGQAGFEPVGGGAGGTDARDQLRQRNLTIAKKDQRLLDLLEKKQDSAPTRSGAVERTELDTGLTELDGAAVRQTMATSSGAYSTCVTRAMKENQALRLEGKRATLMLTIKPSGVVQSAWIAEAELDKSPLGKCLVGVARRMVFPAFSGDPIDVSAPLALSGGF